MSTSITQLQAGYEKALKSCGTADASGNTIGVVEVNKFDLGYFALIIRMLGFIPLLMLGFIQRPFGFLPDDGFGVELLAHIASWEVFSTTTWMITLVLYALYVAATVLNNSIYLGIPGVAILFSRHGKIVHRLMPGQILLSPDPRTAPSHVISTKVVMVDLMPVTGYSSDNFPITTRAALVQRVVDPKLLAVQGGFDTYFRQLQEVYQGLLRDLIQQYPARAFNTFLIESADNPDAGTASGVTSIEDRLAALERSRLTVEFVSDLCRIGEVDVTMFALAAEEGAPRHTIVEHLQQIAKRYGVEIIDYVPQGNLIDNEYFRTLAVPLVESIQRILQAAEILKDVLASEIKEEIAAHVAKKQQGLLELRRLIGEIDSVRDALQNETSSDSVIEVARTGMRIRVESVLTTVKAEVEGLIRQIQASELDVTGIEMYIRTQEALLREFEEHMDELFPGIRSTLTASPDAALLCPDVDVITLLLERAGYAGDTGVLQLLRNTGVAKDEAAIAALDERVSRFKGAAEKLANTGDLIQQVQKELDRTHAESGVDVARYTPEEVQKSLQSISGTMEEEVYK